MKYLVLTNFLLFLFITCSYAQTKAELEERRNSTLNEINYVDNMLKSTAKKKVESMNAIKIIGNKLSLRETVIKGMRSEINLVNERIDLNTLAINMMERDLVDYQSIQVNSLINKIYF